MSTPHPSTPRTTPPLTPSTRTHSSRTPAAQSASAAANPAAQSNPSQPTPPAPSADLDPVTGRPIDPATGQPIPERRQPDAVDRRATVVDRRHNATGLERRRGPGRRRTDFIKSAEEGQMTPEQFLFIAAIDAYKRVNHVPFPSWTQVLEVIRKLGYRKTCPSTLQLSNAEDWLESPDAPTFPGRQASTSSDRPPGSRALQPDERD